MPVAEIDDVAFIQMQGRCGGPDLIGAWIEIIARPGVQQKLGQLVDGPLDRIDNGGGHLIATQCTPPRTRRYIAPHQVTDFGRSGAVSAHHDGFRDNDCLQARLAAATTDRPLRHWHDFAGSSGLSTRDDEQIILHSNEVFSIEVREFDHIPEPERTPGRCLLGGEQRPPFPLRHRCARDCR